MQIPERRRRRHSGLSDPHVPGDPSTNPRTPGQSDRDRLLYSSHLRRLAGVTQVVGPREGHVFHNRLTHTLKVAQLAERLAQRLCHLQPEAADKLGPIDSDVVEAAALAHDLGHPPFGHVAEEELNKLVDDIIKASDHCPPLVVDDDGEDGGLRGGFEGNAQSFRIITRLATHKPLREGLDLSRATLNAVLKYPWFRQRPGGNLPDHAYYGSDPEDKFGAYRSDARDFEFARGRMEGLDRSVEAEIMDYADALAYSVHDLDDFVRAGLVPVGHLIARKPPESLHRAGDGEQPMREADEFHTFFEWWVRRVAEDEFDEAFVRKHHDSFVGLLNNLYGTGVYSGKFEERGDIRQLNSILIERFLGAVELQLDRQSEPALRVDDAEWLHMRFLQGLVRYYVIEDTRLATQQRGQRQIIRNLFEVFLEAVCDRDEHLVPGRFSVELAEAKPGAGKSNPSLDEVRLAADIVSSFTDYQATFMHQRLLGTDPGSVMQPLPG